MNGYLKVKLCERLPKITWQISARAGNSTQNYQSQITCSVQGDLQNAKELPWGRRECPLINELKDKNKWSV